MFQPLDAVIPVTFHKDLTRAVQILKDGGCSEVYVFGSVAEDAARDDSDLDLAVRGCPKERFFELFGKLLMELDHAVDLVDLDQLSPFAHHLWHKERILKVG